MHSDTVSSILSLKEVLIRVYDHVHDAPILHAILVKLAEVWRNLDLSDPLSVHQKLAILQLFQDLESTVSSHVDDEMQWNRQTDVASGLDSFIAAVECTYRSGNPWLFLLSDR